MVLDQKVIYPNFEAVEMADNRAFGYPMGRVSGQKGFGELVFQVAFV